MAGNRNPTARHEVLWILLADREGIGVAEIADRLAKNQPAVYHLLRAMLADRVVRRTKHGHKYLWYPTGSPLPPVPETKQRDIYHADRGRLYDFRALAAALDVPSGGSLRIAQPSRIHLLRGGDRNDH